MGRVVDDSRPRPGLHEIGLIARLAAKIDEDAARRLYRKYRSCSGSVSMRSVTQYWPKRWRKRLSSSSAGAPEAMARPEAGAGLAVHDGSHDGLRHRPASLLPAVPVVGDFQLPPICTPCSPFAVRRPHHR
jgi:hypothetical protein